MEAQASTSHHTEAKPCSTGLGDASLHRFSELRENSGRTPRNLIAGFSVVVTVELPEPLYSPSSMRDSVRRRM